MDNLISPNSSIALMQAAQSNDKSLVIDKNMQRIEESAREFEAVFISEMMKPMFEGVKPNETFGGGKGEEIFNGIMLQEYGKNIAALDIIGIQSQVKNKLIELQAAMTTGK